MNKVIYIEVFTARNILTNQPETRIKFSRENTGNKYYIVRSLARATQITSVMAKLCTAYVQVDPEGYMCSRFEPKPTGNKILKDLGHTSSTITPRYVPPTESADYVICPNCEKKHFFNAWVYAHWDIPIRLTCKCGKQLIFRQGELFK